MAGETFNPAIFKPSSPTSERIMRSCRHAVRVSSRKCQQNTQVIVFGWVSGFQQKGIHRYLALFKCDYRKYRNLNRAQTTTFGKEVSKMRYLCNPATLPHIRGTQQLLGNTRACHGRAQPIETFFIWWAVPIKFHLVGRDPGLAHHFFRGWTAVRPGPSFFQRMGRDPTLL